MYQISIDGNLLSGKFLVYENALAWIDIIKARDEEAEIKLFYNNNVIEVI